MSTTDKLEHALRDLTKHCVRLLRSGRDSILQAGGDCDSLEVMERGDPYLAKAREALAEYDATPAVEVTADAVEVEIAEQLERWLELGGVMDTTLRINLAKWSKHLRALAAAHPALVQQVERLRAELEAVNGAIGGKYTFFKERHGVGHQTTKALSQLIDLIAKKRDAAAAQAKQAEGG